MAVNDSRYVAFLDEWTLDAGTWPKDWKESGLVFVDLFRRFGCQYLSMSSASEAHDWRASGLVNNSGAITMPPEQPLFWPVRHGGLTAANGG